MNKTIFDVDDIYTLRIERAAEYAAMPACSARKLRAERANCEWNEVAKIRKIINNWYKCPNKLSPQPDKLPMDQFIRKYDNSPRERQ